MRKFGPSLLLIAALLFGCSKPPVPGTETSEVTIPRGAGGVGFLPLLVMEKSELIQKHAREAGIALTVNWADLGGPGVMNDSLIGGAVDFSAAGPPAFLTLWDKTRDTHKVQGVAAISSMPMYLNTRADHLKTVDDLREGDKVAMTATGVSIPAIILQMYAARKYGASEATRFDRYALTMPHSDGVIGLKSDRSGVSAHFTSLLFHQRELKDGRVRTLITSDQVMGGSTTFTMLYATSKFREQNPEVFKAVLQALDEAIQIIESDKKNAAEILRASPGNGSFTQEEMQAVISSPDVKFTLTPEHMMKYAQFMKEMGTIKNLPASWKEFFFPESQELPGS